VELDSQDLLVSISQDNLFLMNRSPHLLEFHTKIKQTMILKVFIHTLLRANYFTKEKVNRIKIDQRQQVKIVYLKNNKYQAIKNQTKTKKVF
jgi:hypothetical protein